MSNDEMTAVREGFREEHSREPTEEELQQAYNDYWEALICHADEMRDPQ